MLRWKKVTIWFEFQLLPLIRSQHLQTEILSAPAKYYLLLIYHWSRWPLEKKEEPADHHIRFSSLGGKKGLRPLCWKTQLLPFSDNVYLIHPHPSKTLGVHVWNPWLERDRSTYLFKYGLTRRYIDRFLLTTVEIALKGWSKGSLDLHSIRGHKHGLEPTKKNVYVSSCTPVSFFLPIVALSATPLFYLQKKRALSYFFFHL